MSTYPGTIDSFQVISGTTLVSTPLSHSGQHNTAGSAVTALETILGTALSGVTGVLSNFGTADKAAMRGKLHVGVTAYNLGTTALSQGQFLNYNGTEVVGSAVTPGGSAGTLNFGTNAYVLGTAALSQGSFLAYNGTNIVGSVGFTSPLSTKGDLYVRGTTQDSRLAVGGDDRFLIADSAQALGVKWGTAIASAQITTINTNTVEASALSGYTTFTNAIIPRKIVVNDNVGTISLPNSGTARTFQLVTISLGTTAGNRIIDNADTSTDGYTLTFRIKQNSNNTGTLVWGNNYRFSSDTGTASLGTASTWNIFTFMYGTTDSKWDFITQTKNII